MNYLTPTDFKKKHLEIYAFSEEFVVNKVGKDLHIYDWGFIALRTRYNEVITYQKSTGKTSNVEIMYHNNKNNYLFQIKEIGTNKVNLIEDLDFCLIFLTRSDRTKVSILSKPTFYQHGLLQQVVDKTNFKPISMEVSAYLHLLDKDISFDPFALGGSKNE